MMLRAQKLRNWIAPWWFSSSQMVNPPAKVERTSTPKTMNNSNHTSKFWKPNTVASYLLPMYESYFGDSWWFMICPILRMQQGYWPRTLYDFPEKIWTFHLDLRLSFEFDLHFCWKKTIALPETNVAPENQWLEDSFPFGGYLGLIFRCFNC